MSDFAEAAPADSRRGRQRHSWEPAHQRWVVLETFLPAATCSHPDQCAFCARADQCRSPRPAA